MSMLSYSAQFSVLSVLIAVLACLILVFINRGKFSLSKSRLKLALFALLTFSMVPAQAQSEWIGWPSADEKDGRFIAVTGPLSAIDYVAPNLIIGIPDDASQFDIELFDGDASANLSSKYDINVSTSGYTYTLFQDPDRDGTGSNVELIQTQAEFANDSWSSYVTSHPVAQAAKGQGGFYWYRLSLNFNGNPNTEQFFNALKVRVRSDSTTPASVGAFKEIIIGSSPFNPVLDPGLNSPENTYDGDWVFNVRVTGGATPPLEFSDSDADYSGDANAPGTPPDDNFSRPDFMISPAIRYELFDPNGNLITFNTDPSGTEEEETFSYNPPVAAPAGLYQWHWFGVDASNVLILRTDFELLPVTYEKKASLGNYVWLDENGDGLQDAGEPGLAGVSVILKDNFGDLIGNRVTDSNGSYLFDGLVPGTYTVEIDPNTLPVGVSQTLNPVLAGSDLGNQSLPYIVDLSSGEVNLTADFGYSYGDPDGNQGPGALGDKVWIDTNGNGIQDAGEAGLGGVELTIYTDTSGDGIIDPAVDSPFNAAVDSEGNTGTGTTTTNADGSYIFSELPQNAYVVVVNPATLPTGFVQTADPDEFGEPANAPDNQTTSPVVLAPGDVYLNVDFGYQPDTAVTNTIGDTVFLDINANGLEDAGEPGISNVTVSLLNSNAEPIAYQTTDSNGTYLFGGLPDGDYTVVVTDSNGILSALSQSADPDSMIDAMSSVSVASGESNLDQDFGYTADSHNASEGLIGDTVFVDRNLNGQPDAGEGLGYVKVQLFDVTGTALVAETYTNPDGLYLFGDLDPTATYTVKVDTTTIPAGLINTIDPDGGNDSQSVTNLSFTSDGINLDQDFGYVINTADNTPGSIGDTVWLDSNADGINDGPLGADGIAGTDDDEPGIEGVTLDLYLDANGDGQLQPSEPRVSSTVTDNTGQYLFDQLLSGSYIVDVSDDAGLLNGYWHSLGTVDANDNSQSDPYAVSLPDGGAIVTADFGYYYELASVGDLVWFDANANGIQDAGEPGIADAMVELTITYPDGSQSILTTVTDSSGLYSFVNLLGDEDYNGNANDGSDEPVLTIRVDAPSGLIASPVNQGSDDSVDSDNPQGELAQPVMGGMDDTNDFGFYDLGSISGSVSEDIDRDGNVEGPLSNVTVILYADEDRNGVADDLNGDGVVNASDELDRDTTDATGNYQFDGLSSGHYLVSEVDPDGYESILDGDVTVDVPADGTEIPNSQADDNLLPVSLVVDFDQFMVENDGGNNFVDAPILAGLGDTVWYDHNANGVQDAGESGIANVTVNLLDSNGTVIDTTVTDSNGNYHFTDLLAGEYTVEIDPVTLGSAQQQTYDLDDGTSATPVTPNSASVTLAAGDSNNDLDFGYRPLGSLGDTVWFDENANGVVDAGEAGIAGVEVSLTGTVTATTTTNADGEYEFTGLPVGSYTVSVSGSGLAGLQQTHDLDDPTTVTPATANTANVELVLSAAGDAVDSRDDVDFGYRQFGSISGSVLDADLADGSNGISGVTITLYVDTNGDGVLTQDEINAQSGAPTTTTGSDGSYNFADVSPGNYFLVEQDPAGYDADVSDSDTTPEDGIDANTPVDDMIPVIVGAGEADNDNDFVERKTGSIGDTVWNDENGNGVQDAGEPGIDGVTVTLFDSSGTEIGSQVTANGGQYLFTDLPAGSYAVSVSGTPLDLLSQTYDLDDGNGPFATVNSTAVTLGIDEDKLDVDFGFMQLSTISGTVLEDSTGDNAGDRVLENANGQPVVVMLELFAADASGNPVGQALALTTANTTTGAYEFTDLLPGDYVVVQTQPNGFDSVMDHDVNADGDSFDADTTVDNKIGVNLSAGEDDIGNDFVENAFQPSIDIRKQAEGYDVRTFASGDTVEFEIQVTNTGLVDLNNVAVSDPQLPACDKTIGFLAAGDSVTYTCSSVLESGGDIETTVFSENFEVAQGWEVDADGNDNATTGIWQVADPEPVVYNGFNMQLADGYNAGTGNWKGLFTGPLAGSSAGSHDIDGGKTSIKSPSIVIPADGQTQLSLQYYFAHASNANSNDFFKIQLYDQNGGKPVLLNKKGTASNVAANWTEFTADLSSYAGQTIRLVFKAKDSTDQGGLIEAGVDDVKIVNTMSQPVSSGYINVADVTGDGGGQTVTDSDPSEVIVDGDICVPEPSDSYTSGQSYSIWINGEYFSADSGNTFIPNVAAGTARYKGSVTSNASGTTHSVDMTFGGFTTSAPTGSPKLPGFSVDASNWVYYTTISGSVGPYTVTRRGPALQVGYGANMNDNGYGASGWMYFTNGSTTLNGDINISLTDCGEPPVVCEDCINGQSQITLKVSNWGSSRDQGETIRVREGGLGGALLFEGVVSNGGSFTFDMVNPGATIVVTVQGYYHPSEYVKGTFSTNCDMYINKTSGNSYITFKVTDMVGDGEALGGICLGPIDPIDPPVNVATTTITNAYAGQCLDTLGVDTNSSVYKASCSGSSNQQWELKPQGSYYEIVNADSNLCLDVNNSSNSLNGEVGQWSCGQSANQLWEIQSSGGEYLIKSKSSGLCLEVVGTGNAYQYTCDGYVGQRWSLTKP